jgi:hypothetical protein
MNEFEKELAHLTTEDVLIILIDRLRFQVMDYIKVHPGKSVAYPEEWYKECTSMGYALMKVQEA